MKKTVILPLLLWGSMAFSNNSEWLKLNIQKSLPLFEDIHDVNNQKYSDINKIKNYGISTDRLILSLEESNKEWKTISLSNKEICLDKGINYVASYVTTDRFINATLSIEAPSSVSVSIDKKELYSFNKLLDKTSISLNQGTHLIIIKCISNTSDDKLKIDLSTETKYKNNLTFSISPKHYLDFEDILNTTSTVQTQITNSGRYGLIEEVRKEKNNSFKTYKLLDINSNKILKEFNQNYLDLTFLPTSNKLSYFVKENEKYAFHLLDIDTGADNLVDSNFPFDKNDSKYISWAPTERYIIYSKTIDYSEGDEWELRLVHGMEDRQPYFSKRSFLYKYDIDRGSYYRLTRGNLSTTPMCFTKDGKQLLFFTREPNYKEYPFDKTNYYLLNIEDGSSRALLKDVKFGFSDASFSEDNSKIVFVGSPSSFDEIGKNCPSRQTVNQTDAQLFIYNLNTDKIDPITKNFDPCITYGIQKGNDLVYVNWKKNNIYFVAQNKDFESLFKYNTKTKEFHKVACIGDMISSVSIAENGKMLYLGEKAQYPKRVFKMDSSDGSAVEVSNPVDKKFRNIQLGKLQNWDYQYNTKTKISGRVYLPPNFDPNKKYPLIVNYYGGTLPVGRNFGGRYPLNVYAAKGYVVYLLQPSGATGFGQEFSNRHQNNWGKVTGDEIIKCTKEFIKAHPYVDKTKIGCIGASYGGFTTMYLQTQTDLFTCAIAHAGISSISSYWGEGYWGYSYSTVASANAYPWNRKDIYVDQSPLFNADKIKTPMLLIHGTKDVNVPTGESIQLYTALKLLNQDVNLIFIKNADHHVVTYDQLTLWYNSIIAYFDKYLKNQPEMWENMYPQKKL